MRRGLCKLSVGLSRVLPAVAVALLAPGVARAATVLTATPVGPITFETANDYTNNFRVFYDNGGRLNQTTGLSPTNYLAQNSTAVSTDNGIAIYDTTPGDGAATQHVFAAPFSVQMQARAAQAGSSIGVILLDPTNVNNNLIALLNIDNPSPNETIRFFKDAPLSTTPTSVTGTQVGIASSTGGTVTTNTLTGSSGFDAGSAFGAFKVDYSITGTTPTLTLTFGSISATSSFSAGDAIVNPEVALRLFDASTAAGTTDVDNFAVVAVPEPASLGVLAAAGVALGRRRRRH